MRFAVALFSCVFNGFWSVCFKKATSENKMGPLLNLFFGYHGVFLVGIVCLLVGWIRSPFDAFTLSIASFFLLHIGLTFVLSPIEQFALKIEKLSALQPYGNVGRIVAIILGFLVLGERNIVTFCIAILAFLCTMVYASGGKFHRFSRGTTFFIVAQLFRGARLTLAAVLLTQNALLSSQLTGLEFAVYQCFFMFLFLGLLLTLQGKFTHLKDNSKTYYKYRYIGATLGDIGWIVGLVLMAELGIITASILSLITMATTLAIGFFLLGDKPEKKDIFFATFIVGLICVGYVFRHVTI